MQYEPVLWGVSSSSNPLGTEQVFSRSFSAFFFFVSFTDGLIGWMDLFTMQDWLVETQDPGNGTAPVKARPALANAPTPRSLVFSYSSRFCSWTPAPRGGVTG